MYMYPFDIYVPYKCVQCSQILGLDGSTSSNFRYLWNSHAQLSYLLLAPCIIKREKEQLVATSAFNSTSQRYMAGVTVLAELEWRSINSHH